MSVSFRRSGEIVDFVVSRLSLNSLSSTLMILANVFNPHLSEFVSSNVVED